MAYIDTKYLGRCETCRHHSNSGCNTYCDHGEEYSPNLSKIPTADVVEVETVSERIIRKQMETSDYWRNDVKQYRVNKGYSNIEHDIDNFLQGYNEAVWDMHAILEERKVE